MARTKSELATAVLRKMGVIAADETASAEDAAYIKAEYDDKHEWWLDQEMAYWPLEEIPNAIFSVVRDVMINEVMETFGRPQTPEDKAAREQLLEKRLWQHIRRHGTGVPIAAEYF
jgi:hypothetical protein